MEKEENSKLLYCNHFCADLPGKSNMRCKFCLESLGSFNILGGFLRSTSYIEMSTTCVCPQLGCFLNHTNLHVSVEALSLQSFSWDLPLCFKLGVPA